MQTPPTRYFLYQIVWGAIFSLAALGAVGLLGGRTESFALTALTILLVAAAMTFLAKGPGPRSRRRRGWSAPVGVVAEGKEGRP